MKVSLIRNNKTKGKSDTSIIRAKLRDHLAVGIVSAAGGIFLLVMSILSGWTIGYIFTIMMFAIAINFFRFVPVYKAILRIAELHRRSPDSTVRIKAPVLKIQLKK